MCWSMWEREEVEVEHPRKMTLKTSHFIEMEKRCVSAAITSCQLCPSPPSACAPAPSSCLAFPARPCSWGDRVS